MHCRICGKLMTTIPSLLDNHALNCGGDCYECVHKSEVALDNAKEARMQVLLDALNLSDKLASDRALDSEVVAFVLRVAHHYSTTYFVAQRAITTCMNAHRDAQ